MTTSAAEAVVRAWQQFLNPVHDWQSLVEGVRPLETGCGQVYELRNPLGRPGESFAIADMRRLKVAEPHYHVGETEIYFVMTGRGMVVVGREEREVQPGAVVVTPPSTAHFTVPGSDLVLAVVNTPPFQPGNYRLLETSNLEVGFDGEQFARLSA